MGNWTPSPHRARAWQLVGGEEQLASPYSAHSPPTSTPLLTPLPSPLLGKSIAAGGGGGAAGPHRRGD